mgnify:CR=1 FL=1
MTLFVAFLCGVPVGVLSFFTALATLFLEFIKEVSQMTNNTCRMGVFGMERKLLGAVGYE